MEGGQGWEQRREGWGRDGGQGWGEDKGEGNRKEQEGGKEGCPVQYVVCQESLLGQPMYT